MRGVLLEAPQSLLDERRRLDLDRLDEMWEGELHLTPLADLQHNEITSVLLEVMGSVARRSALRLAPDAGLWAPREEPESYRVPDLMVFAPTRASARGVESGPGALLVVEIRSPRDETYAKLPFYDRVGVTEMLVVDRPEGLLRRYTRRYGPLTEITATAGAGAVSLDTLPGLLVRWSPEVPPGVQVERRD